MSGLMLVYVLGCKYRPTARDLLVFAPVYDAYVCQPTYDFSTCIGGLGEVPAEAGHPTLLV